MLKKIQAFKDILWALAIGVSLIAVFIGFIFAAVKRYNGPKEARTLDLGSVIIKDEGTAQELPENGTVYGELRELVKSKDAGEEYISSACFLTDSVMIGLKNQSLTGGPVWSSESGTLPMSEILTWNIVYSDGSKLNPGNACMVAKPAILVLAIGSDGLPGCTADSFISGYKMLISNINASSPNTKIICCAIPPVTSSYIAAEGLNNQMISEANGWIRQICTDTGCYYTDPTADLITDGQLSVGYAEADGKTLNTAGLQAVLSYLRNHALT